MMDEKWMQQVAEWAAEKGIPEETLFEELRKLEAKGEIGLTYLKNQMTSKVETQEDARTLFRMAAQEGFFSDTDDYIEVFPNLGRITIRKAIKDFMSVRIKNDRLQKRNIMLTPELWHTLVENKKELVTDRILKKTIDVHSGQILFSQVLKLNNLEQLDNSIDFRTNCDALILRTIQFDFLNTSTNYDNKKIKKFGKRTVKKYADEFEAFFEAIDVNHFNNIYKLAENCKDFSIHEYYLPYGLSKEGLEKAVLLTRYDHCSEKHKNSSLLKYYSMTYDPALSEPHFHFNEGFGQIYKLLTKSGQGNFGSGFAISVPALCSYLNKLKNLKNLPADARKFWKSNDFGMPFLKFAYDGGRNSTDDQKDENLDNSVNTPTGGSSGGFGGYSGRSDGFSDQRDLDKNPNEIVDKDPKMLEKLNELARDIYITNAVGEPAAELQYALNFFNTLSGTSIYHLESFEIVGDHFNHEEDFRDKDDDNSRNK
jgi:hypothetical protein